MRCIILKNKILCPEIINIGDLPSNPQTRKRPGLPLDLNLERLDMILVHMGISHRMNELASVHFTYMRNHFRQQRV